MNCFEQFSEQRDLPLDLVSFIKVKDSRPVNEAVEEVPRFPSSAGRKSACQMRIYQARQHAHALKLEPIVFSQKFVHHLSNYALVPHEDEENVDVLVLRQGTLNAVYVQLLRHHTVESAPVQTRGLSE